MVTGPAGDAGSWGRGASAPALAAALGSRWKRRAGSGPAAARPRRGTETAFPAQAAPDLCPRPRGGTASRSLGQECPEEGPGPHGSQGRAHGVGNESLRRPSEWSEAHVPALRRAPFHLRVRRPGLGTATGKRERSLGSRGWAVPPRRGRQPRGSPGLGPVRLGRGPGPAPTAVWACPPRRARPSHTWPTSHSLLFLVGHHTHTARGSGREKRGQPEPQNPDACRDPRPPAGAAQSRPQAPSPARGCFSGFGDVHAGPTSEPWEGNKPNAADEPSGVYQIRVGCRPRRPSPACPGPLP